MEKDKRPIIAKAGTDGSGEIRMYGQVTTAKDSERDYYEESITPKKFADALASLGKISKLKVHLNSLGGDAYAGIAIHNAIKKADCEVEVIVDGIAASAGSVIMCAGDKVTVNPSSIVMIHGAAAGAFGFYNAEDLAKMSQSVDAINKSLVNVYKAKTGKEESDLADMIAAETWLVGQEIVDAGFADEISGNSIPVSACLDTVKGRTIMTVNDEIKLDISGVKNVPESILTKKKDEKKPEPEEEEKEPADDPEEDEDKKEAEDSCKQKKKKCEADNSADQILVAVMAERKRIQEIDSIASAITDKQMLNDAKFNPDKICDARELAFRQLQADSKTGRAFLKAMDEDYAESNLKEVEASNALDEVIGPGAGMTAFESELIKAAKELKE